MEELLNMIRELVAVYREENGSDKPEDQPDVIARAMVLLSRYDNARCVDE